MSTVAAAEIVKDKSQEGYQTAVRRGEGKKDNGKKSSPLKPTVGSHEAQN